VPVERDELHELDGADRWSILTIKQRLDQQRSDPWSAYGSTRQGLTKAMLRHLGVRDQD